jgi:hypothetical protein
MSTIPTVVKKFKEASGSLRPIVIYARSIAEKEKHMFFLIREKLDRKLVIISPMSEPEIKPYFEPIEEGEFKIGEEAYRFRVCRCSHEHACSLRRIFPFTRPFAIGLKPTIGMGDRIGLATPGHIRAAMNLGVSAVLAQQSIREMDRTGRTPDNVLDDVSWAVFQEGYREGFGADADHLKTIADVDQCFKAGYTMYTIDPSDYVDNRADTYNTQLLEEKFYFLPWESLESGPEAYIKTYASKALKIGDMKSLTFRFTKETFLRAACKYAAAIAHTAKMFRHLKTLFGDRNYDIEMSVDESETPTSPLEHLFIAWELKRLKVRITGLALRYVGRFEKAIDYIGDPNRFAETFKMHASIAKLCGPYKLSIHSGSDKFSIFPLAGKLAGKILHLKTAGTSYLQALRIVARRDSALFREIVDYSLGCFEKDRKSYDVTTDLSKVPPPSTVSDEKLEWAFLDENNGRQLLHITYGSVLTAKKADSSWLFRDRLRKVLVKNEKQHYQTVEEHLKRHIKAVWFSKQTT